jgi:maleate isomerase
MTIDFVYGSGGIVGIAPPQANPTVEPEMAAMMPPDVTCLTTRLRGDLGDARQRFKDYLLNLEDSLRAYGGLKLDALGFACTATTYLLGDSAVAAEFDRLGKLFGFPIVSSAEAIKEALRELSATRIAVFGPYPGWLQQASFDYWSRSDFELVAKGGLDLGTDNTTAIYRLTAADVVRAAQEMDSDEADAIVLTGTGAPTFPAIPELRRRFAKPVLSSNLCLAWALLRRLNHPSALPAQAQNGLLIDGGRV